MCAAVAQRQLVRRSSVGPRKTGVDTKLVGKHSQTWSWGWWGWVGLVGGANGEHGCLFPLLGVECRCIISRGWRQTAATRRRLFQLRSPQRQKYTETQKCGSSPDSSPLSRRRCRHGVDVVRFLSGLFHVSSTTACPSASCLPRC